MKRMLSIVALLTAIGAVVLTQSSTQLAYDVGTQPDSVSLKFASIAIIIGPEPNPFEKFAVEATPGPTIAPLILAIDVGSDPHVIKTDV